MFSTAVQAVTKKGFTVELCKMLASVCSVPLRVNVRFIQCINPSLALEEIDEGAIAPPSTPDDSVRSQKSK